MLRFYSVRNVVEYSKKEKFILTRPFEESWSLHFVNEKDAACYTKLSESYKIGSFSFNYHTMKVISCKADHPCFF